MEHGKWYGYRERERERTWKGALSKIMGVRGTTDIVPK
jgi:hypothetical protein